VTYGACGWVLNLEDPGLIHIEANYEQHDTELCQCCPTVSKAGWCA